MILGNFLKGKGPVNGPCYRRRKSPEPLLPFTSNSIFVTFKKIICLENCRPGPTVPYSSYAPDNVIYVGPV